jgi:hypothetical protein
MNPIIYLQEVTGKAAWHSADLTEDRWLIEMPATVIGELEAMAATALDAGVRGEHIRVNAAAADSWVSSMQSPATDELAAKLRSRLEIGPGFALLRRLPVERYTPDEAILVYSALTRRLGQCVTQNARGETLCEVRDHRLGGLSGETVRGYQTAEALPFHTDAPDVAALLCLQQSTAGGQSAIASATSIYNEIVRHHREYLGTFYTGVFYDWRGEGPPGGLPVYRNPIFGYFDGQLSCRYYLRQFAESAGRHGFPLAQVEREALALFEELATRRENQVTMQLERGDVQFVDNNVVVHARLGYSDQPDAPPRCLLRTWINFDDGRVFPPYFARTRGGFVVR